MARATGTSNIACPDRPSAVRVRANGVAAGTVALSDDPADSRGVLSWHAQLRDKKLSESDT